MKNLRLKLEAAGLAHLSGLQVLIIGFSSSCLVASWVQLSFGVLGLTLFAFLAVIGIGVEGLSARAKRRSSQLARLWPEIIDSMHSASSSGFGIVDSLNEIAKSGPISVRAAFQTLVDRIDSGFGMDRSLDWFKAQFGNIQADRLTELIRLVHRLGGAGYMDSLREQAARTRAEISLWGELESKQGWVSGTAKLAIVAPWIIVATLSARPENVAIYNTNEGLGILTFGLIVSLLAYRLVNLMGSLSKPRRVFIK